jgi:hypothetical protein
MRAAALGSLGKWVETPKKENVKRLFACASDADFRVAAPALMILKNLPAEKNTTDHWLALLQAPDVAVRKTALEKLGELDTAPVADALVKELDHPDRSLRDEAILRLTRRKHGRKALVHALLGAGTPDKAWPLARAQASVAKEYPAPVREKCFTQACAYLEAGDRRADPLLFLLREVDAAKLRNRLEVKALTLRKKKDYATALLYLRLLARDPACGFPIRFELAACGLRVSSKDLTAEAWTSDPSLQQFVSLSQHYGAELAAQVQKAKWLEPEDLYYVGFHLAQKDGPPRTFAGKVLHLVVKRAGKSKIAQAARNKIRTEGLG